MTDESEEVHPALAGRSNDLHSLAQAVRRLASLTVTNLASPSILRQSTKTLLEVADRLADHVPTKRVPRYLRTDDELGPDLEARMPFDVVIGRYNPIALPVEISLDPPRALGSATFTDVYEGPPGCVHGAVLAATFDMVLTAANTIADAAGPTASLTLRYRRPTLLDKPVHFEAAISGLDKRRTRATGRAVQDGVVTVEAEGMFVALGRDRINRLHVRGSET
jgi:acyl-coenzyme A thioesterase PaaI-like protein